MFKFNFNESGGTNPQQQLDNKTWLQAKQCHPDETVFKAVLKCNELNLNTFNNSIKYVSSQSVIDLIKNPQINEAHSQHSDLIPAVYEGGLKIWECTRDMADYIYNSNLDLKNKHVLDLGCGAGIIGIIALLKGSSVCFQDYNEEVVQYLTIPNVMLNRSERVSDCKFYSGDWGSFLELLQFDENGENIKFDYIFTCETIYNVDNYMKLHDIFKSQLKADGAVFVSAKSYYFGVGGSIKEFQDLVTKEGFFDFSTCWEITEGVPRQILKLVIKNVRK